THTVFAPNAPVNGGDIFIIDNEVFLIERVNGGSSKLYNITSGVPIFETFVATSVNGASATAANGFIVSSGNYSSSFYTYDADGSNEVEYTALDAGGNLFTLVSGDMAGGCFIG